MGMPPKHKNEGHRLPFLSTSRCLPASHCAIASAVAGGDVAVFLFAFAGRQAPDELAGAKVCVSGQRHDVVPLVAQLPPLPVVSARRVARGLRVLLVVEHAHQRLHMRLRLQARCVRHHSYNSAPFFDAHPA